MPRKARVLVPNCPHHVVQRGHNRKAIFVSDEDYQYYLENLREWKEALDTKLYRWCLMTNHIHLIVEPGKEVMNLPLLMKRINGRQSAYVNNWRAEAALYGRVGIRPAPFNGMPICYRAFAM
ncbi:MAG: transposase [Pseudomonadota bacterium]